MENSKYVVHVNPDIDIFYDSKNGTNQKFEQEFKMLLENAFKNNPVFKAANARIKYFDFNEHPHKKSNPNEEHPVIKKVI